MSLQKIADGLWYVPGEVRMPGGVIFPCRMTIVKLSDGRLWLHSPVSLTDEDAKAINALGEVAFLVAPNCFHHLFMKAAMARFPTAKVYGAPKLNKKRPDIAFTAMLEGDAAEGWPQEIAQLLIKGIPGLNEVVFFHAPSRTLIVTDLIFNMRNPHNWRTAFAHRVFGVYKRCAQSRLLRMVTKDRAAAGASVAQMLTWGFDRVVMAHGDILERDGKAQITQALTWMLAGAQKALPAAS
jgi:hypothetical protein